MNLIANENMKIYRRARTWVMMAILVALVLAISIIAYSVGGSPLPSMWEMMSIESAVLFLLVTIFTVILSADSVAGEFGTGTIKLLLIRPWSRSMILLSKYISLLLFALLLAVILFVVSILTNVLLFGADSSSAAQDVMNSSMGSSPLAYMLEFYLLKFVSLIVTVTLAFMLSTIFRSGGLAIGLSLFILLGLNTFIGLLAYTKYKWVDYLLFIHLELTQHMNDQPLREGTTLGFSLSVLAVYYVAFLALTWYIFNKRDVAA